jgi:hypothetical protein
MHLTLFPFQPHEHIIWVKVEDIRSFWREEDTHPCCIEWINCAGCESVPLPFSWLKHPPSKLHALHINTCRWPWFLLARGNLSANALNICIFVCISISHQASIAVQLKGMWMLFGSLFKFSHFHGWDLHRKTCVALSNLLWSISRNRTSPGFVIGSAYLLISQVIHKSPNCVHYCVRCS